MVCPHCRSQDIITVQGQFFCVGCGRTLQTGEVKSSATSSTSKSTTKRGPGRPRAPRLDVPISILPGTTGTSPAPVLEAPATEALRLPAISAQVPALAEPDHRSKKVIPHRSLVTGALAALNPFMVLAVLPATVALTIASWLLWRLGLRSDLSQHWLAVTGIVSALILGLIFTTIVQGVVIFYRAGVRDHRLQPYRMAWRSAIGAWFKLVILAMIALLGEGMVLGALALVIMRAGTVGGLDPAVRYALTFIVCLALIAVWAALWVTRPLTTAGVMMGQRSLMRCLVTAWRLWRRHPEMLGIRLAALAAWVVVTGGAMIGLWLATTGQVMLFRLGALFGVAFILFGFRVIMTAGSAEAGYRYWYEVSIDPSESRLLGARPASRHLALSLGTLIVVTVGLCAVVGLSVVDF